MGSTTVEFELLRRFLQRYGYIIAIPTLLALIWSAPAIWDAAFPPERYQVVIEFSVAAPPDAENIIAADEDALPRSGTYEDTSYVPWIASEFVVLNLPSWVTGSQFAALVSEYLGQQGSAISADEIHDAISADNAYSTMTVYFEGDNRAVLEAIADASITVLQTRHQEYFPQLALQPAQIVPLDEVEAQSISPPITTRLQPFIRVGLGVGVGLGLAMLAAYVDDRIYAQDDLEALDIVVVATIPRENR
jgi:hypothetical protein